MTLTDTVRVSRQEMGRFLKGLRKERRMSLHALAGILGISISYLSRLENGKVDLSVSLLQSILAQYRLTPTEQTAAMRFVFRSEVPTEEVFETVCDPKKDIRDLLRVIGRVPNPVTADDLMFLLEQQKNYTHVMNLDLVVGMLKQRRL